MNNVGHHLIKEEWVGEVLHVRGDGQLPLQPKVKFAKASFHLLRQCIHSLTFLDTTNRNKVTEYLQKGRFLWSHLTEKAKLHLLASVPTFPGENEVETSWWNWILRDQCRSWQYLCNGGNVLPGSRQWCTESSPRTWPWCRACWTGLASSRWCRPQWSSPWWQYPWGWEGGECPQWSSPSPPVSMLPLPHCLTPWVAAQRQSWRASLKWPSENRFLHLDGDHTGEEIPMKTSFTRL